MKIAVIGTGKSGSKVLEQLGSTQVVGPFHSRNRPTVEALQKAQGAILFVPGNVALELIPLLVEAKTPAVFASTGLTWPADLDARLKERGVPWIYSANFSLGMAFVRPMIKLMSKALGLLPQGEFSMEEIHHTKKLDAPSGTALLWQKWLGVNCPIESKRQGDVVGIHEVSFRTEDEVVTLRHEALDRGLFARGAIFAAQLLVEGKLTPGLHSFDDVTDRFLSDQILQLQKK